MSIGYDPGVVEPSQACVICGREGCRVAHKVDMHGRVPHEEGLRGYVGENWPAQCDLRDAYLRRLLDALAAQNRPALSLMSDEMFRAMEDGQLDVVQHLVLHCLALEAMRRC